mgnify:CR=1 FL=1
MKKKFKILILIFLILNSFNNNVFAANGPKCYDLFDQIKNEWKEKNLHYVDWTEFNDYGFEAEYIYSGEVGAVVKRSKKILRSFKTFIFSGM